MEETGEEVLVRAAQKGDRRAFMELARRHQEKIYYAILGLTRSRTDADDLAQETFMAAFRSLKKFKMKSSFYTWTYKIAINLTLNHLKRLKREKGRRVLDEGQGLGCQPTSECLSPEGNSLKDELVEKIKTGIDSLPFIYRAAFNLVVTQGLSHGEAAKILGCSEKTVSWRMHKARKMLRAMLNPLLREDKDEM